MPRLLARLGCALLLSLSVHLPTLAQDAPPVVMNLAAHPDDEDGRTLAYYRHAQDAVAYSVIFTRGEGGQNEIGPELYEALGAIRTDETERAARHLGTQVQFLNFYDFGYSKFAHEAFEAWGGRDHVTARLVYLLRTLKPDVLFTNHDTVTVGPGRQHGQHQAVGLAAYDAFELAADPTYHPEQLDEPGVDLWQPKRLFLRHWQRPDSFDVAVPVGAVDPSIDAPYTQYAADALREHASQGMGMWADRMHTDATYFTLLRSATDAPPAPADLAGNLPPNTAATPDLAYGIDSGRVPALPDSAFTLGDAVAVPGQRVQLRWDAAALPAERVRWTFTGAIDTALVVTPATPGVATLRIDPRAMPTLPKDRQQYTRFVNHPPVVYGVRGLGEDAPLLAAGYLPLEVAPPLALDVPAEVVRLRAGANALPLHAQRFDPEAGRVPLSVGIARDADRTVIHQMQHTLPFDAAGNARDTLRFTLPADLPEGDYTVTLTALAEGGTQAPAPVTLHQAARVLRVDVPEALRVGVIESYDDALSQALGELGVTYTRLDSLALAEGTLDSLHTIVIDIRAYLVRPDLRAYNDRLLDWVERGGHLVVNYQKTFEWNPQYDDPFIEGATNPDGFAPYPLRLGRDRVTYEDAPVTVLQPEHPFFHTPNAIDEAAWDGWIQERGLYFPASYDDRYVELFAMNDPGEPALRSSTLLADYGAGTYLYTALGWYRQLKVFHPGAFALFANMISLPLTDGRPTPAP